MNHANSANWPVYECIAEPVTAIPLPGPMDYSKWGHDQHAKAGDMLICSSEGDIYTCDGAVFARTYSRCHEPNRWRKTVQVRAIHATESGKIQTLEGVSDYAQGDYIVRNPDGDMYSMPRHMFDARYMRAP